MIIYAEKELYACALLEPEELDLFAKANLACWAEKGEPEMPPQYARTVYEVAKANGPEYWQGVFNDPERQYFVLFRRKLSSIFSRDRQFDIAGQAGLIITPREDGGQQALFCNGHILAPYRGKGLSKLLYEARLNYLAEETDTTRARIEINKSNKASIAAAKANGFHEAARKILSFDDRLEIEVSLERDLENLRRSGPVYSLESVPIVV